jgi:NAD(P)-dependent dehydrogenase (short-subunit alcohol dehydrogenase family)
MAWESPMKRAFKPLAQQVVVITGASSGIGRACALAFGAIELLYEAVRVSPTPQAIVLGSAGRRAVDAGAAPAWLTSRSSSLACLAASRRGRFSLSKPA